MLSCDSLLEDPCMAGFSFSQTCCYGLIPTCGRGSKLKLQLPKYCFYLWHVENGSFYCLISRFSFQGIVIISGIIPTCWNTSKTGNAYHYCYPTYRFELICKLACIMCGKPKWNTTYKTRSANHIQKCAYISRTSVHSIRYRFELSLNSTKLHLFPLQ